MVVLAVTCGIATFYESSHGTAAAQRDVYQTRWFTALLSLLAVNILLSMLKRYPWSRHQAGFVMAHVGIVLLLVGSLISLHVGLDGTVALYEGDGTNAVTLRERALAVEVAGRQQTFPADFDAKPPRPDRPAIFVLPGTKVTLVAEDYAPHAEVREAVVRPAAAPSREERRTPAVRVRFDSPAGGTAAAWLPWGGSVGADLAEGAAAVSFGEREVPLPFRLTLLDFRADTYPGSPRPASYESRVRIEETDGTTSEHLISMNHPLHHRGYIFFQASFVEGQPMMSILSVSRSPGLPLVYLGTALVSLGVAWMFYVKPWLVRRQARRAARRPAWTGSVAEVTS
jgi:ResB-like family protein